MSKRKRRSNAPHNYVRWWAIVSLVSVMLAGVGFAAGKYWVGGLIKPGDVDTGAPQIIVDTGDGGAGAGQGGDARAKAPPEKAEVTLSERAPTVAERAEVESQLPQDGAQLHKSEDSEEKPDESLGSSTKALPTADSKDDKKDTAEAPAKPATRAGGGSGNYRVVTGSFSEPQNAQRDLDSLAAKGFPARIIKIDRDGKVLHRVVVGAFDDRKEAEQLRNKLKVEGVSAAIVTQ